MIGKGRGYLKQVWNWIDLTGIISVWIYCTMYLIDKQEEVRLSFLTYSTALIWWKSFSYTRFKKDNRFFIRTVGATFSHIQSFLRFMILYTLAFAVIFLATETEAVMRASRNSFWAEVFEMYKFDLGKSDPSGNTLKDIIYVPATILVTILLFNLLIAMVRDAYLKVKQNIVANDYIEIANIVNDYQSMARWNLHKSSYRYLFVC